MGKTLTEKILASKAGRDVAAGEIVVVPVDLVLLQDGTGPLAIRQMQSMALERLANPAATVFFIDHAAPSPRRELSNDHRLIREFAARTGAVISDIGGGVCHQVICEQYVRPGDLLVGADSHTCMAGALAAFGTGMGSTDIAVAMALGKTWLRVPEAMQVRLSGRLPVGVGGKDVALEIIRRLSADGANYMALEFAGDLEALPQPDRFTIANMAVEAGAKAGLFLADAGTRRYLRLQGRERDFREIAADADAAYAAELEIALDALTPRIALPHTVDNVRAIEDVGHVRIEQVFLGSCTNGRLEDLRAFADLIKGHRKSPHVRLLVAPASHSVYAAALSEGVIERLLGFGGVVCNPGCGVCVGVHQGVLGDGERCLSTSNRNFKGRMGNPEAEVYLASPLVAAATAIEGRIADPRKYLG